MTILAGFVSAKISCETVIWVLYDWMKQSAEDTSPLAGTHHSAAVMQWLTACLLQGKMHIKKGKADTLCGYTFVGVLPCKDSRWRSLVHLHFKTGLYFSLGECCMSQHREALRSENFQVRPLIHCIVQARAWQIYHLFSGKNLLARRPPTCGMRPYAHVRRVRAFWGRVEFTHGAFWKLLLEKKLSPEACMSFVLKQKPGGELASKQKFQQSWGPVLRLTPCPPFLSSTDTPRLITLF